MGSHNYLFIRWIISTALTFVFMANPLYAGDKETDTSGRSLFMFSAGIVAAFSIHEAAHATVAELTGTEMDWEIGNYNQPLAFTSYIDNKKEGRALYSAGLISQVIGSEIILQSNKIDKNSTFIRGMMAWNIINPIMYSLDYWFIHRTNKRNGNSFQGDIEGIEHYSNRRTANAFALSMVGMSLFQGYRFVKTQSWAPDWGNGKSYDVSFSHYPSEGVGLKFIFYF